MGPPPDGTTTADGASSTRLRLTLLGADGRHLGYLTGGGSFADGRPEWAKPGVLLERVPADGGPTQLWFAAGAGSARTTGLTVDSTNTHLWDWSTTPPTGRSNG